MKSHPNFKFKAGDIIVPHEGKDVPRFLKEIKITDVRPAHYKGLDLDGDLQRLNPMAIDSDFQLKPGGEDIAN